MPNAAKPSAPTYVLDTSAIYLRPQTFELPELSERPAAFAVPHTTLSELDILVQRPATRAKARAALNVLKQLVDRGATTNAVTWGNGASVRLLSAEQEDHWAPSLRLDLADDRILAAALALAAAGERAVVVTAEFAMHARALTLGMESVYLEGLAATAAAAGDNVRRQIEQLETAWGRLVASTGAWQALGRATSYLRLPAAQAGIEAIRSDPTLAGLSSILQALERFAVAWQGGVHWHSVVKGTLGINPPKLPDTGAQRMWVAAPSTINFPITPGFGQGEWRTESAGERESRLRLEERWFRDQEEFIVDNVINRIGGLHHWIVGQLEADT